MVPDGLRPPQDPPAASRPSKAGRGEIFFLAQTVPFDLRVKPVGVYSIFGSQNLWIICIMSLRSRSEQRRRAKRAVVASDKKAASSETQF